MNLRNVGDSELTAHHTVLVEMCLHLKPTGFSPWVVHLYVLLLWSTTHLLKAVGSSR